MRDEDRFKLLHGPYQPPVVAIGDWIECEIRGPSQVAAWSDGPIPWPRARRGKKRKAAPYKAGPYEAGPYIVCGDLARAIQVESHQAIRHWWGVGFQTVTRWRRALSVKQWNEGTQRVFRDWLPEKIPPEMHARAIEIARHPRVQARAAHTRRVRQSQPRLKPWTPEEEALLGTMSDVKVGQKLGRATKMVGARRRQLAIAPFTAIWSARRVQTLVRFSPAKLLARRLDLALTQQEVAQRAGTYHAEYSHWETGFSCRMKHETLTRLAAALECEVGNLIEPDEQGQQTHSD